jgi:hypothetical protein
MTIQDNDRALPLAVLAEAIPATDTTLSRIETVINLLLLASLSAESIREATTSDHDRLHAAMVSSALDEALAAQRILWFEMAPTMTPGLDEPNRYCDVTRHYERQRSNVEDRRRQVGAALAGDEGESQADDPRHLRDPAEQARPACVG